MKITMLYFAALREALGTERESVDVPAEVQSAGELRAWLAHRGGVWSEALAPGRALRMAVNRKLADPETPLAEGAEVAVFPPVTGG
ncbi:MAG: molybdopterin converting factor subunit 1 [Betaproteobacteria bacterium]|nr:molybdopterin converting factor subunit 1 [Betaproteobacteria bacterium]